MNEQPQGIQLNTEQAIELVNVLQTDLAAAESNNRILKTNVNLLAKEVNRLNGVISEMTGEDNEVPSDVGQDFSSNEGVVTEPSD